MRISHLIGVNIKIPSIVLMVYVDSTNSPQKNLLLTIGGAMGLYLFITQGIPKGKTLVFCWVSFNVLPLIEGLVSSELSKPT